MANIWIDVEDLFEYARENARPSGIQRLAFEMYAALLQLDGGPGTSQPGTIHTGTIHFVRHAPLANSFRIIDWPEVLDLFTGLTEGKATPSGARGDGLTRGPGRDIARRLVHRMPAELRLPTTDLLLATRAAAGASVDLARATLRTLRGAPGAVARSRRRRRLAAAEGASQRDFATLVRPGDILLVCGSPWYHPDYDGMVRRHREKYGLRFALLVYDLIPLRRPEWCDKGLVRLFRSWFATVLPECDLIFAISHATARDVVAYTQEAGITLAQAPVVIPIGTGVTATAPSEPASGPKCPLPAPGSYALIVSTIEARKNHLLLFRVWRRLLEEKPAESIPTLVFAGRVGWLVDDLMRQISNTDFLNGKLVLIESPSDADLARLYAGCRFTLFPSFYEGWGLPVTESLALGKPCLIADRTSLPEAGGALVRSFDPDNLHDAYARILEVIEDPEGLAAWEARVRRDFRPVPWTDSAAAILSALGTDRAPDLARPRELEPGLVR